MSGAGAQDDAGPESHDVVVERSISVEIAGHHGDMVDPAGRDPRGVVRAEPHTKKAFFTAEQIVPRRSVLPRNTLGAVHPPGE